MPPKKDAVHRYFNYDQSLNTSVCELCKNKLKGKHTTNLKNHLATKHTDEFKIVENLNSDKVCSNKSTAKENQIEKQIENIKKNCVRLVTVHGRPLSMMEDDAFQEIIKIATASGTANNNIINVKIVKNRIQEEAFEIKQRISSEVKNRMISLKLDAATCLERKFLGINIQYIMESKIVIRNLALLEIYERQTSTFLKEKIEQTLTEFLIAPEQIYCICTDNGSNMIKMVKMMGGSYISEDVSEEEDQFTDDNDNDSEEENVEQEQDNIFSSSDLDIENLINNDRPFKVRGMLCAAHTLQLAVKDAMTAYVGVQTTLRIAKLVVNALRKPNNANHLRRANLRKAIKDCPTRWTSTYNMLVRLLTLKDFCSLHIQEVNELVSEEFWQEMSEIVTCLQPVNEATIKLQKEQLTIGDFYATWLTCKTSVASINHSFAVALHNAMIEREAKLLQNDVVLEAMYLDGRLNLLLTEEQCQKARKLLKELHAHNKTLTEEMNRSQTIEANDEPVASTSAATIFPSVEALLQSVETSRRNTSQTTSFEICLQELCVAPRVDLNENIIQHWQNKAVIYSEMATIAKIVLAAPATQVSVERLFSSLKFILHPLRSNMSSIFLKDIMLIRENKDLL